VSRDPDVLPVELDGVLGDPREHLLADQSPGHRVGRSLDHHVRVGVDLGLAPQHDRPWLQRQRQQMLGRWSPPSTSATPTPWIASTSMSAAASLPKQPLELAGATIHFSYDDRGRLVSETGSEHRWSYAAGIVGDHDSSWTL
jgi:YD repeat-containing protein